MAAVGWGKTILRVEQLVKRCRTGDLALRGITLEVPEGQVMALIGPSGAGKSTLIRCINRLVEPTSGRIWLSDQEITALGTGALRRVRQCMGMFFQEYALVKRFAWAMWASGAATGVDFPRRTSTRPFVCWSASDSPTWAINAPTNCLAASDNALASRAP
jgi:hypothetical protein